MKSTFSREGKEGQELCNLLDITEMSGKVSSRFKYSLIKHEIIQA